jgi:hypothetical protein
MGAAAARSPRTLGAFLLWPGDESSKKSAGTVQINVDRDSSLKRPISN